MTKAENIAEILMRIDDPEKLSAAIRDHIEEIDKGVISSFKDMRKLYLEQGDLHKAWTVSLIQYEVACQSCVPLEIIASLDELSAVSALIASRALDEGRRKEAEAYASRILNLISTIFLNIAKYLPSSHEKQIKALLKAGLDVFAKYRLLGLEADLPEGSAVDLNVQEAIQKLHDNGIFEELIQNTHKALRQQLGILLLQYAEGNLRLDLVEPAQSFGQSAVKLLGGSEFEKETADAYNLLGRVYERYGDGANLLKALECLEKLQKLLRI